MTCQLRGLKDNHLIVTFTTSTAKEALQFTLNKFRQLREDLVLYGLEENKMLRILDTRVYRRVYEKTGSLSTFNL